MMEIQLDLNIVAARRQEDSIERFKAASYIARSILKVTL